MANTRQTWGYSPRKPTKPKMSEATKRGVEIQAGELVETVLKPKHIMPADERFNYVADIFTKWYGNYFYFCSTYCCPSPMAISPSFEVRFARLEYVGPHRFALAFMRHTGQWVEIDPDASLEECLTAVSDDPLFHP